MLCFVALVTAAGPVGRAPLRRRALTHQWCFWSGYVLIEWHNGPMLGLDAVLLLGAEELHNGPLAGLDAVVLQGAEEWHNGPMPGLEFSYCLFLPKQ